MNFRECLKDLRARVLDTSCKLGWTVIYQPNSKNLKKFQQIKDVLTLPPDSRIGFIGTPDQETQARKNNTYAVGREEVFNILLEKVSNLSTVYITPSGLATLTEKERVWLAFWNKFPSHNSHEIVFSPHNLEAHKEQQVLLKWNAGKSFFIPIGDLSWEDKDLEDRFLKIRAAYLHALPTNTYPIKDQYLLTPKGAKVRL